MKKSVVKRILSFFVMCMILISTVSFIANAVEITPRYNNVSSVASYAEISSSGVITITNKFSASASVFSRAVITTYVERKTLGLFWTRVDIGQTDDEWVDTIYNNVYSGTHSHQLEKTGTYRVTVEYVIFGSGGAADTITREIEEIY